MFTEDFARAGALYHELVAAHPQDARLLLAYGNALSGAKQYKEAPAQFDRAKVEASARGIAAYLRPRRVRSTMIRRRRWFGSKRFRHRFCRHQYSLMPPSQH
jgi:tetratricopeptide (TPR) repeat protein